MTEEKKVEGKPQPQMDPNAKRRLVIETDGNSWGINAQETKCTALEIKEICREIIMRLGSS